MSSALDKQREHADRLQILEQKGVASNDGAGRSGNSLGDRFVKEFAANRESLERSRVLRLEIKAAGDAVTTGSGRTVVSGGVGAPGAFLGFQAALPGRNLNGTSAIEYSRYTGQQGAAAVQAAEGDTKASVRPDHSLIQQSAITIAGITKMSRQALNDSAELKLAIDGMLSRSVAQALDVALVNGSAAPAFAGFEALATASTSTVYQGLADAVSEGVAAMQTAGFSPAVVGLNPADWLAIQTAKGSDGHYLSGAYLGTVQMDLRGLRVVLSPSIDAGKALLLDPSHAELLTVDGFSVEVAYSGDDFSRNLVTVLGETRVIPVFRTTGAAKLITPKP